MVVARALCGKMKHFKRPLFKKQTQRRLLKNVLRRGANGRETRLVRIAAQAQLAVAVEAGGEHFVVCGRGIPATVHFFPGAKTFSSP